MQTDETKQDDINTMDANTTEQPPAIDTTPPTVVAERQGEEPTINTSTERVQEKTFTPHKERYIKGCTCPKCIAYKSMQKQYRDKKKNPDSLPIDFDKPQQQAPAQAPATGLTDAQKLDLELNDFSTPAQQPGGQAQPIAQQINISDFISGALFLMVLDYTFPLVVKFIFGRFDEKYKKLNQKGIDALGLTDKEKKELEPLAQELVNSLLQTVPKELAFLFAYGAICFGKAMMLNEKHFDV